MPATAQLLVFTRGPRREARRRRLLQPEEEGWERLLHRRCLERILEAGRSWRMSLTVSTPGELPVGTDETDGLTPPVGSEVSLLPQASDGGFGSRLEDAVGRVWVSGSGPLIVVGTDTPELGARQLGEALARLRTRPDAVVLGPSPDGGIYLLATRRPVAGLLRDVAWCTSRARADLESALRQAGVPVLHLAPLPDLDSSRDLVAWLARRSRTGERPDPLVAALRRLVLDRCRIRPETRSPGLRESLAKAPLGRGPPVPSVS